MNTKTRVLCAELAAFNTPLRTEGHVVRDNYGDAIALCHDPDDAMRIALLINAAAETHRELFASNPLPNMTWSETLHVLREGLHRAGE